VIKRISLLVTAALMAAMMMVATAAPAFAANAPTGCVKVQGTINCPDDAKNDKFDGNQLVTKKGSVNSSHEPETTCLDKPCPRGQFKDSTSPIG
jgi:hypothetical protein